MKEKDLWAKIKDNLNLDYIKRIENELEPGWPDTFYMHDTHCGWAELKIEEKFPSKINFEPGQPIWLSNYYEMGGTCYIILYVKNINQLNVWSGKDAMILNVKGGTKVIEPVLCTAMNNLGWTKMYELFSNMPAHLRHINKLPIRN